MFYINGIGSISPQQYGNGYLENPIEYIGNRISCLKPDYTQYIDPVKLRRMSKLLKMGWVAAKTSLKDANIEKADAIITGTGMGCFSETERFLLAIYENGEQFLPATPFMQSAHSTIGSQIAMMSACNAYNMTFSHRGFSFETALLDACLQMLESDANNILVGGIDEIADNQFLFQKRIGRWKQEPINNFDLLHSQTNGTISGEGAAYFVMGRERSSTTYAQIKGVHSFSKPLSAEQLRNITDDFLSRHQLEATDIDLLMLGINGDKRTDTSYHEFREGNFPQATHTYFKHLCGEYPTATAFATWLSSQIMKRQQIPEPAIVQQGKNHDYQNLLIYNHYKNDYHSLILLAK